MSSMRLFVGQDGVLDALKCLAAAALHKADVKATPMTPALRAYGASVILEATPSLILGAQPACRFLAGVKGAAVDLAVDEWLEWDANVFGPVAASIASGDASDATKAHAAELLTQLNGTVGDAALAPATVAGQCVVRSLAAILGSGVAPASLTALHAWHGAGTASPAFTAASKRVPEVSAVAAKAKAAVAVAVAGPAAGAAAAAAGGSSSSSSSSSSAGAEGSLAIDDHQDFIAGVAAIFTAAIKRAFPALAAANPEQCTSLVRTSTDARGKFDHDLQCDSSMAIFGALRKLDILAAELRSPRDVAQAIIDAIPPNDVVARTSVAGGGFINVWVSDAVLARRTAAVLRDGLMPPKRTSRRVAIDYSSPNIAKDMHVGHLRSTIIGDAIARILEYMGHTILRINHAGDWGTQFGMLLAHIKEKYPDFETSVPDISNLTTLYKDAKVRFDAEPDFKDRAHREVVALQAGDATNLRLWRQMVDVSAAMFNDVYSRLGVDPRLELFGESFYNDKIPDAIKDLDSKGLLVREDGALVMFCPPEEVPLMVQKSDGGYGYDSTDLAAIKYRLHALRCDWLIYVIDSGQSLHLRLVFEAARRAGWYDPVKERIDHVGFGIVQGEDKKRFRTRSGETVRLVDLLDEARDRMAKGLRERREDEGEGRTNVSSDEELLKVAEAMGYGAVKYFDLRQNRNSDYVFSYDRMLASDGDTAVYLQYQFARMKSILRKAREAGMDVDAVLAKPSITVSHASEHRLLAHLITWQDACTESEETLMPHHLCKYIYDLATRYAEFQRDCRVIGDAAAESRLCIVAAALRAMSKAMEVVGIPPVERM